MRIWLLPVLDACGHGTKEGAKERLSHSRTPRLGTDGNRIIYPVRGIDQVETVRDSPPRSSRLLVGYVLGLAGCALVVAVVLHQLEYSLGNPWVLAALSLAAAITERASVRVSGTTELSISPVLTLFAAVLFGPLAGGLVGAASELGDAEIFGESRPGRSVHLKWLTYSSTRFLVGAAMGLDCPGNPRQSRLYYRALRGNRCSVGCRGSCSSWCSQLSRAVFAEMPRGYRELTVRS